MVVLTNGHPALMFRLDSLSVLEFSGQDAGPFLHNQLSADINAIPSGDSGFACCCNPAGRVIGLLLVCVQEETIFALCASDLAEPLQQWLSRFVIRADVKIELRPDLTVASRSQEDSPPGSIALDTDTGLNYAIIPASNQQPEFDSNQAGQWSTQELKAGVIWLDKASSTQFLPQMLGFESIAALSFNKGCYPGQEIIARTRYLGNLKRRPMLLHASQSIAVEVMEKISLNSGQENYSAVVVASGPGQAQDQYLFVVLRASQDVDVDQFVIHGQSYDLDGI